MTLQEMYRLVDGVSRTFSRSIHILPEPARRYVGHAYLLCRLLDSFEDDAVMPLAAKRSALTGLRTALLERRLPGALCREAELRAPEDELEVVRRCDELFAMLDTFPEKIRQPVTAWAAEMADGMKKYAFGPQQSGKTLIRTTADLMEYCYFVAGTVGHMLTAIFLEQLPGMDTVSRRILHAGKEAFGTGLQLVNIIKDCGADFRESRCFIPEELFRKHRIPRESFFRAGADEAPPVERERAAALLTELIDAAKIRLAQAHRYTAALPRRGWRYRLFCVFPLVLAYATLYRIAEDPVAVLAKPGEVKLSRREVKRLLRRSLPAAFSNLQLERICRSRR